MFIATGAGKGSVSRARRTCGRAYLRLRLGAAAWSDSDASEGGGERSGSVLGGRLRSAISLGSPEGMSRSSWWRNGSWVRSVSRVV